MNKKIFGVFVVLLAVAMLAVPVFAKKPTSYNLTASQVPTGPGYMEWMDAGKSGNSFFICKDWLCVFSGQIIGVGYYTGRVLDKPNGESLFIGYWTFDEVTLVGVGTGGLRIGCINTDLWIESGSGELSSIRGRGTAIPAIGEIQLTVYINP